MPSKKTEISPPSHYTAFRDYKAWIKSWIQEQPRSGYGQYRKLAESMGVRPVIVSQIFNGDRDLSPEQAVKVTQFCGFNKSERNFFLILVSKGRAGSRALQQVYEEQENELRNQAKTLKNRINHEEMSEELKTTFYSQWYFSAIRLASSIPEMKDLSRLSKELNLKEELVARVIQLLLENKLIVRTSKGYDLGPSVTHLSASSPLVNKHHMNWRFKALGCMENKNEDDLFYTAPMALSVQAQEEIRSVLVNTIQKAVATAKDAPSESLSCLNIDWFRLT